MARFKHYSSRLVSKQHCPTKAIMTHLLTATAMTQAAKLGHAHIIDTGVNVANLDHFQSVPVSANAPLTTDPYYVLETIFDPITFSSKNLQARLMSL